MISAGRHDEFLQGPKVVFQPEKRVLFRGACKKGLFKVFRRKLSITMGVGEEKAKMHGLPFSAGSPAYCTRLSVGCPITAAEPSAAL
ncbi:MAG: hypothetical protein AMJ60_09085 [Desulfobacterales bacterium SG8_35]|nr:MAG: hypothetical protein AMJ60_09085 [Desulfobacterales bacterium SG8_35]